MRPIRIDNPESSLITPKKALATFKGGMSCCLQYELLAFLPWKSFFQNGSVFFVKAVFLCLIKYLVLWRFDHVRIYIRNY